MALSGTSVEKAKKILAEMMDRKSIPTVVHTKEKEFVTGKIILQSRVGDGYENVYMNIPEMTKDILDYFYNNKNKVPNSHFINFKKYKTEGVVQIGWF